MIYLRLYNSNGTLLTYNDDGGSGLESRISYNATNTGTYYLSAGSYADRYSGSYLLSTTEKRAYGDFAPNLNLSSSNTWSGIDRNNVFMQGLEWELHVDGDADQAHNFFELLCYDGGTTMGGYNAGPYWEGEVDISLLWMHSSVANLTFSEGILQENLISFGLLLI